MPIRQSFAEPKESDPNGYERIIGVSDLVSINFLDRGRRAADAVCRIRVPGQGGGWLATGVLVGPRLLLTNNHVLSSRDEASIAECEFEYEHDADGVVKNAVPFNLAPHEVFFTDVELDITFVAIAAWSDTGVPVRRYGHIPLVPVSGKAVDGEWVTVIQHPGGQPKQLAIRSSQIVELRPEEAPGIALDKMIHYTTDTEPGSSGGVVVNDQWQMIALHHRAIPEAGQKIDADLAALDSPSIRWIANEGIRISAIYDRLEERRLADDDAAATLERLEVGLGVAPLATQSSPARVGTESEGSPFKASVWASAKDKLGFDGGFLSTTLELEAILGNKKSEAQPLIDSDAVILNYLHFSTVVHKKRRFPMLTAVNIDGRKLGNPGEGKGVWRRDIRMDASVQPDGDFYSSGAKHPFEKVKFERGHLVRRIDPCWGTADEVNLAEQHTLHYTNAAPQVRHFNNVDWGNLEDYVLDRIQAKERKMSVFSGPIFREADPLYGKEREDGPWRIPQSYWKIAVIQKTDSQIAAAAFIVGQPQYVKALYEARVFTSLSPYTLDEMKTAEIQTTIKTVEAETGLNFEALRPFDSQSALEATRQTRFLKGPDDIVI